MVLFVVHRHCVILKLPIACTVLSRVAVVVVVVVLSLLFVFLFL